MTQVDQSPRISAVESRVRRIRTVFRSDRSDAVLAAGLATTPAALGALLMQWGQVAPLSAPRHAWVFLLCVSAALVCISGTWRTLRERRVRSRTVGPYTLGEKIGEGGMGVVYKASHSLLKRPTAVKLLHPKRGGKEDVRRFEREVQLTSQLTHPNTISIYDFGRASDGAFYYAMEYLDGLDLQTLVEREGPQPPARVAHLLAQLCGALSEAHGVGLIHRDVKPANVVVSERGGARDVVKVLDFGLIAELGKGSTESVDGDAQTIAGTPLYLSPEALTQPESMDGRSDLYAVGAVGYFLLTGAPPFSGNSVLEVCAHHLHTDAVPPSRRGRSVPGALERLILSCLEKSMDRRPASAAALREALLPLAAEWTGERLPSRETRGAALPPAMHSCFAAAAS